MADRGVSKREAEVRIMTFARTEALPWFRQAMRRVAAGIDFRRDATTAEQSSSPVH